MTSTDPLSSSLGLPQRVPYVLEHQGRTVIMGEPMHLAELERMLQRVSVTAETTLSASGAVDGVLIDSVGVDLSAAGLWERVQSAAFDAAAWPQDPEAELTVPEPPAWLRAARCWEWEPLAPVMMDQRFTAPPGPGETFLGGWLAVPSYLERDTQQGTGSVGLFQLQDRFTFWVLASADDLEEIRLLAQDLARYRRGFDRLGVAFDEQERVGSLRLPIICREILEDELIARGADIEPRFWAGGE